MLAWRGRPVVIEIVDIVRPGLGRQILRLASRYASATVVNSQATAAALEGDAHRAIVIHPGVDLVRYHPATGRPDRAHCARWAAPGDRSSVSSAGSIEARGSMS